MLIFVEILFLWLKKRYIYSLGINYVHSNMFLELISLREIDMNTFVI